jgi:hypothetical protein
MRSCGLTAFPTPLTSAQLDAGYLAPQLREHGVLSNLYEGKRVPLDSQSVEVVDVRLNVARVPYLLRHPF